MALKFALEDKSTQQETVAQEPKQPKSYIADDGVEVSLVLGEEPSLIERFGAAQATFDVLVKQETEIDARVKKGIEYLKAHPADVKAISLLNQLKKQFRDLDVRSRREAETLYELEKEIVGDGGGYVCPRCLTVQYRACGCLGLTHEPLEVAS